jgi:hypothetical protein
MDTRPLLVTHPGLLGDLLWALPVVRKRAEREGAGQHLYLSTWCQPLKHLLEKQEYIDSVTVDPDWAPANAAPLPPRPPEALENVGLCLGLGPDWPTRPLPFEYAYKAGETLTEYDLRPWIHAAPFSRQEFPGQVLFHWSKSWYELKLGLTTWVIQRLRMSSVICRVTCGPDERWPGTMVSGEEALTTDFPNMARKILASDIVVTDNSAVHVLCAALGHPVLVVEPEPARHNQIFWPGSLTCEPWQPRGRLGELIRPVLGNDGKPTFDCRHTLDAIKGVLWPAS